MHESDEIRIVYDRRSGQTHLMTPDLAAVFDALAETPGTAEDVLARLSRSHAPEVESGTVLDAIAGRLRDLYELALVDPLP